MLKQNQLKKGIVKLEKATIFWLKCILVKVIFTSYKTCAKNKILEKWGIVKESTKKRKG